MVGIEWATFTNCILCQDVNRCEEDPEVNLVVIETCDEEVGHSVRHNPKIPIFVYLDVAWEYQPNIILVHNGVVLGAVCIPEK